MVESHEWAGARALEKGETTTEEEVEIECFDGTHKIILDSAVPLRKSDGSICGAVTINQDITERKKAEAALKESEVKFRSIFDNAAEGILLADLETKKFYMGNNAICRMLGYSMEEITGLGVMDIHTEKDSPYVIDQFERQAKGEFVLAKDLPVKRKDGSVFYADVTSTTVKIAGKTYLLGFFHDNTERKRMEDAIKTREEKYCSLFENSRDALMILEPPSWKFTSCNNATLKMFNARNMEEFTSLGPWDVSPKTQLDGSDSGEKAQEMIGTAIRDGSNFFEWTHKRIDGGKFPATILLTRMEVCGKALLQATVRDITGLKEAEVKLRNSREYLERVINSIADPVFVKDVNSRFVLVNDALCNMWGLSRENMLGKTLAESLPEDQIEHFLRVDKLVLESGQENVSEELLTAKDGKVMSIVTKKTRYVDNEGNMFLVGVIRDITKRNIMENELKKRVLDLERLLRITVDRELTMIALKKEINKMLDEAGKTRRY
ncbi:MAG: PAS domain S-box protein [Candidatus Altiarchaeota archaeon]